MWKKNYTGLRKETKKHISLGAGAVFVNFDPITDTYETAKTAGKILGATQGGGEFKAQATFRQLEVDGASGRVKSLTDIEKWEVSYKTTLIETSVDTIKAAIAAAKTETTTKPGYTKIEGKSLLDESDYKKNITFVGSISGSEKPIIIQVFNALNEDGFTFAPQDNAEGKIACTFYGYNDLDDYLTDTVEPPFAIWYPDITSDTPTTPTTPTDDESTYDGN
jgi:hypothetical protein